MLENRKCESDTKHSSNVLVSFSFAKTHLFLSTFYAAMKVLLACHQVVDTHKLFYREASLGKQLMVKTKLQHIHLGGTYTNHLLGPIIYKHLDDTFLFYCG